MRPLIERRGDLILVRRFLLVTPIRHLMRGVYFWRSSSSDLPNVGWFMLPLCKAPSPSQGLLFCASVPVGSSLKTDFQEVMEARVRGSLQDFVDPVDTIERFYEHVLIHRSHHEGGFTWLTLDRYPLEHGPVLAALGRLEEARAVLAPAIERDEQHHRMQLADGQALLAKRANSGRGKDKVKFAGYHLPILAELRRLLVLLEANDRAGVASLLHEWERANVKKWGIEHLWEPTPFPLEEAGKSGG